MRAADFSLVSPTAFVVLGTSELPLVGIWRSVSAAGRTELDDVRRTLLVMALASLSLIELALHRCPPFVGARAITTGLRWAGANVATSTVFWGMPKLVGPGDVASRLEIGELCGLNYGCYFELDASITLEAHVAVGHEVMFLTRTREAPSFDSHGSASGARPIHEQSARPIRVEAGSWLGSRCTILPGVTIGAGSVVGANVVVRESLPPNTLLAGKRRVSISKWR